MKTTHIVALASLAAAGTLVLAACGSPVVSDLGVAPAQPTAAETPTPTPAPTNTPAADQVCRDIHISTGADGNAATNSAVYISALSATSDASEALGATGFAPGAPITLCAATAVGNRSAVTVLNDVTIAVSLPQSNCACAKLLATGSLGTLYGGADTDAIDVTVSKDSMAAAAGTAPVTTDGVGLVTAAGSLKITFKALIGQVSANAASCTAAACDTAVAAATAQDLVFTTGTVISQVTNTKQGGTVSVTTTGTPFTNWADPTVKGAFAGGAAQLEDVAGVNKDVAEVQRVAEQ